MPYWKNKHFTTMQDWQAFEEIHDMLREQGRKVRGIFYLTVDELTKAIAQGLNIKRIKITNKISRVRATHATKGKQSGTGKRFSDRLQTKKRR